jgi:hypothetical protein
MNEKKKTDTENLIREINGELAKNLEDFNRINQKLNLKENELNNLKNNKVPTEKQKPTLKEIRYIKNDLQKLLESKKDLNERLSNQQKLLAKYNEPKVKNVIFLNSKNNTDPAAILNSIKTTNGSKRGSSAVISPTSSQQDKKKQSTIDDDE